MERNRGFANMARQLFALLFVGVSTLALASSPEDDRAKIRKQSQQVLAKLYEVQPSAKKFIAKSSGYATFSKWGLTLGPVGAGIGRGLSVAKPSGAETFMRYVEGSAGAGFGAKKYALIFVFENEKARLNFVNNCWEAGAQTALAVKPPGAGIAFDGAASVSPGVWVYQVTDKGLAAEIGVKGTKYYKDKALNEGLGK